MVWYCVHVCTDTVYVYALLYEHGCDVYVYALCKKCWSGGVPCLECLELMNLMLILQSGV